MPTNSKQRGFTILEMAISLAIAGIAIVSLLKLFSTTLLATERSDRVSAEAMLARSKLVEAAMIEPVSLGARDGVTEDGFRWRIETKNASFHGIAPTGGRSLISVRVSIWGPGTTRENADLSFETLAYLALH